MAPKEPEITKINSVSEDEIIPASAVKGGSEKVGKLDEKKSKNTDNDSVVLPWYRRGGMEVNLVGMGIIIASVMYILLSCLPSDQIKGFTAFVAVCIGCSSLWCSMKTTYCVVVVPLWMAATLLCFTIPIDMNGKGGSNEQEYSFYPLLRSAILVPIATIIAIAKVNICMSVCYHRYAAHAGFKCGPITSFFVKILGCLSFQGGPLWWSSMHRRHHRHCDVSFDPHSPAICGVENAFAFFELEERVTEEFTPRNLDTVLDRIIDTWAFTVVAAEQVLSYLLFGRIGLYLSFISGMFCQSITLWFNVVNHPIGDVDLQKALAADTGEKKSKALASACLASDHSDGRECWKEGSYLPFYILDAFIPLFGLFVMEGEHKHHHDHPQLAKRDPADIAYWGFLYPLELLGLVWDVRV
mmetsp:Transcript_8067/g.12337  ORF Transcript_8067/g.12337 Transcript_8067/m.12337 type:complete len:412 (-) Transcript_8067:472-1707(-)|eukprot:CAMPEP_0178907810 /NCGR_PEP_ID=MMETSP0786-20121207/7575_1 /TAXON_ID=186022 /ORGANISM="Thalassionema frauenfeldii, Strain CCMP 1798" /LENGTH=411 /DNA_ID=CAMNT_0020579645 /DNA_START=55 /DNA_END=1290 /DNA_ORIENTATION=-